MKIKRGDNVIVIAGKDRGKTGKVLKAFPKNDLVLVEGVNVKKKSQRPSKRNQKGQILEKAMPAHVSNVMIIDPKTGARTRIGHTRTADGTTRVSRKSGASLE